MDGFKEFQGKSLDDAIREACNFFDASREKLEIDIIQDSKTGIFGLVGARKAKVKARRVQLRTAVENVLGRKAEAAPAPEPAPSTGEDAGGSTEKPRPATPPKAPAKPQGRNRQRDAESRRPAAGGEESRRSAAGGEEPRRSASGAETERGAPASAAPSGREQSSNRREKNPASGEAPAEQRRNAGPRRPRQQETPPAPASLEDTLAEDVGEGLQVVPFEELDQERLRALSLEVVGRLVEPVVGQLPLTVELLEGRVSVRLDCGDDSGLLIGREGQTLASLQYLASRMVSRGMGAVVRVQLDAGEYRLRQDEKLRDMALALAEKVRATGKSYSTRPLSSYHRRIVHMVLQDAPDVQTRSSGDGPLKRVVVQRKKA